MKVMLFEVGNRVARFLETYCSASVVTWTVFDVETYACIILVVNSCDDLTPGPAIIRVPRVISTCSFVAIIESV
jgi:hypothetical protein